LNEKIKLRVEMNGETEFIASHFSEMSVESIKNLDVWILKVILNLDSLRIESEDWLLGFIFELGSEYFEIVGSVRFEYLSFASID
jgi:hypothetical protein